ncbi:MAG: DUF1287 domain-containing protein [Chloroflexota bacterium]|nr:DUF1287 domain-containing protein [Chloroflexota bacterium]
MALLGVLAASVLGCGTSPSPSVTSVVGSAASLSTATPTRRPDRANLPQDVGTRIALAAEDQVGVTTIYDPSFVTLAYPNGDVPIERGVCTDVIVRAFRAIGIDLQVKVHEDMKKNFSAYPKDWGLTAPNPNIDHRRVQNLTTYFQRMGKQIKSTFADESFKPGDVVAWQLSGWMQHIGIVAVAMVPGTNRHYIIHNMGSGTHQEDALHYFTIIGHYRW